MAATTSGKALTKNELLTTLSEKTGLSRKEVSSVLDALQNVVQNQISKRGPGVAVIPGMVKILKIHKPARPARKNVPNPFKPGELMNVAAKPAKNVVKVRPLKSLKEAV